MTDVRFTCPRRYEDGTADPDSPLRNSGPDQDTYATYHGMVGQERGCTYCGSLSAADFLQLIRTGATVGPTDKSYKFYIDYPSPRPDDLHIIGSSNSVDKPSGNLGWVKPGNLDPTLLERLVRERGGDWPSMRDNWLLLGKRPTITAKFYTQHFGMKESHEFLDLWKADQIHWGPPGHPYVRIYLPGLPGSVTT